VPIEEPWDEEATGMPDPWKHLRGGGVNPYGPEGEIFQITGFANGVRRASGWRRVIGVSVAALLLTSILGSAFVSILQLAGQGDRTHVVQNSNSAHLP
jgi:hypothetical protein